MKKYILGILFGLLTCPLFGALHLSKEVNNTDVSATYWRVAKYHLNMEKQTLRVVLRGWKNKTAYDNDKGPIKGARVVIEIDDADYRSYVNWTTANGASLKKSLRDRCYDYALTWVDAEGVQPFLGATIGP